MIFGEAAGFLDYGTPSISRQHWGSGFLALDFGRFFSDTSSGGSA